MNERIVGLDFLKVFATFQVILFHIYQRNGYGNPSSKFLFNFFCVLSKTNNFHFMLISGYVGTTSKFILSKTFPMILATIFYSLFDFFDGLFFFKKIYYNQDDFIRSCCPLAYRAFWYNLPFLIWQFIFSLISPTLEKLNQKYHLTICIIFLCLHVLPWAGFYAIKGLSEQESIGPFLCMSFIASYIKYHYKNIGSLKLIILYILLFVYNYLIHQKPQYFQTNWQILKLFGQTWILRLPSLLFSIPLFFISLEIKKQEKMFYIAKIISECSIGIYMLHNSKFHLIYWIQITRRYFMNHDTYWINALNLTIKTLILGTIIEKTRQHIFNCLLFKRCYYQKFSDILNKYLMGM